MCVIVLISVILLSWCNIKIHRKNKEIKILADKHLEMFLLYDRWIENKQNGKHLGDYLRENSYENIIIYGMSYVGKRFYKELVSDGIEVKNIVDQNKFVFCEDREIKQIDESIETVDAVVVTAIYNFEEIEPELKIKFKCPILSLADIIYKM